MKLFGRDNHNLNIGWAILILLINIILIAVVIASSSIVIKILYTGVLVLMIAVDLDAIYRLLGKYQERV